MQRKRSWDVRGVVCEDCGGQLTARRGCRDVRLICDQCGNANDLKQYGTELDDSFDEDAAFVPMDRL